MNSRYIEMAKVHNLRVYCVNLNNNLDTSIGSNFINRLKSKKTLQKKISELIAYLEANSFQAIYLSNAEGYVSHNFIYKLKKHFSKTNFIALQHGIFTLSHYPIKEFVRLLINYFVFFVRGIFPFGAGFGGIKLNQYYVYSERERQFLIEKKGWSSSNITVDIKFIKAELYQAYANNNIEQDDKTALFLLQALHLAGVCSKKEEKHLILTSIEYLSKIYDKLLIKEHPANQGQYKNLILPVNVKVIDTISEGFEKSKTAYSFFSTSLIDAKVFNIKTVGILSDKLTIDREVYENFDLKIHFENTIDI